MNSPVQKQQSFIEKLTELSGQLDHEGQKQLLEYTEFLLARYPAAEIQVQEPKKVPRPEQESVVAAMKRLSATYDMLDRSKVLHESSALMAEHMLQGREAESVIDDLETMFQRYYQKYCDLHG